MAWRVGDNKASFGSSKKTVRHVDGDALLAFGLQSIHQQGKVQAFSLSAEFFGVSLERLQLIFEDQLALVEQSPDEG
jgi:hypothetical protein